MHPGACDLRKTAEDFLFEGERNTIAESEAMSKEYAGMPIFRTPVLVGISAASDPLYPRLRDKSVIGNFHCLPSDWVSGAESVISIFLPFSNEVCTDNSKDISTFSYGWMHARNEGQTLLNAVGVRVKERIEALGGIAVIPSLDSRFRYTLPDTGLGETHVNSVWSERHIAFISGLGTFGLSTCLITNEGTAGRFISIVTDLKLEPTPREYTDIYEYCIRCGLCLKNCPVNAIYGTKSDTEMTGIKPCTGSAGNAGNAGNTAEAEYGVSLKDIQKCSDYVDLSEEMYYPRYGCGKCQVKVPCMNKRPQRRS